MAHQAHHLPWHTLASNFKFSVNNPRFDGKTNLFPRYREDQSKKLLHFINAFEQTIDNFTTSERAKWQPEYTVPATDDVVISATTARRIRKTIREVQASREPFQRSFHYDMSVPFETRKYTHVIFSRSSKVHGP
jgi:hypothetical protein